MRTANAVPPGSIRAVALPGTTVRVLSYPDGSMRFEHHCRVIDDLQVVCAPKLQLAGGHRLITRDPLHIEPSILCPDCGTHGFIRDGKWVPA